MATLAFNELSYPTATPSYLIVFFQIIDTIEN